MVCGRCGREFDRGLQDFCGYCKTVHTKDGEPIRDIVGVLGYIAERFGAETLLDLRRTDALVADIFPKENAIRRLIYVALYDGCARKLIGVRGKPFEVRCAAAARCVKSLRDEVGLKGKAAADAVEAVGQALGCEIAFKRPADTPISVTESKKNITDAAEQYSLGRHFDRIKDYERAMYWFQQSALQDFGEAQYYVGFYRLEGRGCTQDVEQAWEWFLRGAENGIPAAQYMTGIFLAEGISCQRNEDKAFEWFVESARAGYEDSVNVVALCYENGVHVQQNLVTAALWRSGKGAAPEDYTDEFAEQPQPLPDDGEALYQSARRCLAEHDHEGAAMFYKRAAEAGHLRAQCSYGKCLYLGSGVPQNTAEAFRWFSYAAAKDLDIAQYNLGIMYLKGVHVEKDREMAKKYFTLAAHNGHEESAKILEKMK